jgi:cytochrome P450
MPRSTLPPGPKGTLLGGSLRDFRKHSLEFFLDIARRYGDLVSFRFGPKRIFLVNHPDLIEKVLVTDARHYIKHFGARMYKPVLGNGLVTSEGDFWLRQRKLAQPAFLKHRVLSYVPVMTHAAEAMLKRWHTGQDVFVHYEFSALTSAIALKALFDLEDAGDRERFVQVLEVAFELMSKRFRSLLHLPYWLPTITNMRIWRAVREVHRVVDGFIAAGRARAQSGNDLLSRLINAQDELGARMDDRQLRDEATTLYLAGHETTSLTLTWSWYLLAKHPDVEAKLVDEWQTVLGGRMPNADDLSRLQYTEAVITEAMRVYPPVYLIGREATKDLELGGYRVRKGYTIFLSQWVSHRDPRFFPDPEQFRPERWLDGLARRLPKYAYFPFGGGPRVCIGNTFAMIEAAVLLAAIGQQYRFTLASDQPPRLLPQITLLPEDGIPAVLQRR